MQSGQTSDRGIELAKFLSLASELGRPLEMFSQGVDEEWHKLIRGAEYSEFCRKNHVPEFIHSEQFKSDQPNKISWISSYEERFGDLPAVWFENATGSVDVGSYQRYKQTRAVYASWDCGPVQPEKMKAILPGLDDLGPRVRVPSDPDQLPTPGEGNQPVSGTIKPPAPSSDKN